MSVIFWGALYATLDILPHMQERRKGRIDNITSIGGKVTELKSGSQAKRQLNSRLLDTVNALGETAARQLNQVRG